MKSTASFRNSIVSLSARNIGTPYSAARYSRPMNFAEDSQNDIRKALQNKNVKTDCEPCKAKAGKHEYELTYTHSTQLTKIRTNVEDKTTSQKYRC